MQHRELDLSEEQRLAVIVAIKTTNDELKRLYSGFLREADKDASDEVKAEADFRLQAATGRLVKKLSSKINTELGTSYHVIIHVEWNDEIGLGPRVKDVQINELEKNKALPPAKVAGWVAFGIASVFTVGIVPLVYLAYRLLHNREVNRLAKEYPVDRSGEYGHYGRWSGGDQVPREVSYKPVSKPNPVVFPTLPPPSPSPSATDTDPSASSPGTLSLRRSPGSSEDSSTPRRPQ